MSEVDLQQPRACPACEQGKHTKCSGWARRSRYTICPCNTRSHPDDFTMTPPTSPKVS